MNHRSNITNIFLCLLLSFKGRMKVKLIEKYYQMNGIIFFAKNHLITYF